MTRARTVRVPALEGPDDAWQTRTQSAKLAGLNADYFRTLCREGRGPHGYPTGRTTSQGTPILAWRKSDVLRWMAERNGPNGAK